MHSIDQIYEKFLACKSVSTDTRNIIPGSIFFALKGSNFNGNQFAIKALELGAAYAVIDEEIGFSDDRCLLVSDALQCLQQLARKYRDSWNIPVIGITGSNGKTTSKELLNAVLSKKYKTHATKGNLNNHIGVPLTILSAPHDSEIAIIEMGANHQLEIKFLCEIADPKFGLICNVGKAHLEGMGGVEGVKKTKKELYDHIRLHGGLVFVNGNDENLVKMSSENSEVIYFGSEHNSKITGEITSFDPFLKVIVNSKEERGTFEVNSNLVGDYNLNNILASICIGDHFKVPMIDMIDAISSYQPSNNRSQAISIGSNQVVMDAYNANPSSMAAAIVNFSKLKANKKLLVLGDMFELGEESLNEHLEIVQLVRSLGLAHVIFIGNDFSAHRNQSFQFFNSTEEAKVYIQSLGLQNHLILVKGSRGMKLESIQESIKS